jgi:hypothetical protein
LLGRLKPGLYRFVWRGSNGFVSRHLFRVGAAVDSLAPHECWLHAAAELASKRGEEPPQVAGVATLHAYAFALDASHPPHASVVRASVEAGGDGITRLLLAHPVEPLATDIAYRIEGSDNLIEWRDATGLTDERGLRETPDGTWSRTVELPGASTEGAGDARVVARIRADRIPQPESR